jgi:hypothetical protein
MASTTSETADFPRGRVRARQDQSVGPAGTPIDVLEPAGRPSGGSHTASAESVSAANFRSGEALMPRTVSVRLIAGAPIALVDHARAERPRLDQVQRDVFRDRRQERRATADDDRIAEHAQLVDEAEFDRRRGQAGAADRDVPVSRVERRSGFLGHRRLGEPALPWTLSSVRLKTTFGIAHQMSANAARGSLSRSDGSVSHTSIVS